MTGESRVTTPSSREAQPGEARTPSPAARSTTSEELFQGQRELLIEHAGETYRLRLTRNGKLILNK